jgi:hypothetical protein
VRVIAQERGQRHQETRGAEAALEPVGISEGRLQRIQLAGISGQTFNGLELVSVCLDGKHDARTNGLAV